MITREVAEATWGAENLTRLSLERAAELNVSLRAREILCEIGLPRSTELLVTFDLTREPLVKLSEVAYPLPNDGASTVAALIVIGSDEGTLLCMENAGDAAVYSFDPNGHYRTRFVNRGMSEFLEVLYLYHRYECDVQGVDEGTADTLVQQFATQAAIVDPSALRDDENWWACVLDQMHLGQL
jgi:hypothetical protein